MNKEIRPMLKNKAFGLLMLLFALAGVAVIIMRVVCYKFEFVPGYYEVDYGRFNFFSFFTVQSNIFVSFYLFCMAFAAFGNKRAQTVAYNPLVRLMVTTYIIVTGAVYCAGIPMGMTPPLSWDNFQHAMLGTVQVFHHMIMPPFMIILFLIVPTGEKIAAKKLLLVGIYPLVYSLFSIIRGALSDPEFYPYPFYRPDFFWNIFMKGQEINTVSAYLLMLPMLIAGIGVFILLALVLRIIHNKLVYKTK